MISIRDTATFDNVMTESMPSDLRTLLLQRCDQITENGKYDLSELTHIIVIESGDTPKTVEDEAGMPVTDGTLFEFVERHPGGWLEAVVILSDDGFGLAFFVPDSDAIDPELRSLFKLPD